MTVLCKRLGVCVSLLLLLNGCAARPRIETASSSWEGPSIQSSAIEEQPPDAASDAANSENSETPIISHPMELTGSVSLKDDGTHTPQQAAERLLNDALGQLGTENPDVSFVLLEVHDLQFQLAEPAQVIPDTYLYESYGPISENEWYVADIVFRGVYTGNLSQFGVQSEPYEPEDFLTLNTCLLKKADGVYTLELNVPVKSER